MPDHPDRAPAPSGAETTAQLTWLCPQCGDTVSGKVCGTCGTSFGAYMTWVQGPKAGPTVTINSPVYQPAPRPEGEALNLPLTPDEERQGFSSLPHVVMGMLDNWLNDFTDDTPPEVWQRIEFAERVVRRVDAASRAAERQRLAGEADSDDIAAVDAAVEAANRAGFFFESVESEEQSATRRALKARFAALRAQLAEAEAILESYHKSWLCADEHLAAALARLATLEGR